MAMKRPIDMWEDKERCCYCKYHLGKSDHKYYCMNVESDYFSDLTEISFGCEAFEMKPALIRELEARKKKAEKKKNEE